MRELPILFSGTMVRAILEGRKTQTRRRIDPQPPEETPHYRGCIGTYSGSPVPYHFWGKYPDWDAFQAALDDPTNDETVEDLHWPGGDSDGFTCDVYASESGMRCPYGASKNDLKPQGDRLWVKETYYAFGYWEKRFSAKKGRDEWHFVDKTYQEGKVYRYAADEVINKQLFRQHRALPAWWKRPAIFMPRRASRITLEVTSVRVERLQDISEADALAEGIARVEDNFGKGPAYCDYDMPNLEDTSQWFSNPILSFLSLWNSINGPREPKHIRRRRAEGKPVDRPHPNESQPTWDPNPWVWVVEFKRIEVSK